MRYNIIDETYRIVLGTITADDEDAAYDEAVIYMAESGRDREMDYDGFTLEEII